MLQSLVLPRCRPEEAGISPLAVKSFLEEANSSQIGLHSFMLLRHGQVAAEAWWAPYSREYPHMLFSLSKSFTSTAIGLAVAEGRLSVDDHVVSFFPDKEVISDDYLREMRVRHLLSMSTGHAKDTSGQLREHKDRDWVQAFLEIPVEHEPGTHFVYNSGASYMLSAIVQKITGHTLLDYLQTRLFEPLEIRGAAWESCPRGINTGGWGLSLKTEAIARFGQLYLQKGMWNGERLIPEAWVDEATSFHVSNGDGGESDWKQGYGYQFWRCRHGAYRGDGAFGQFCLVMPEQDAVIAITSGVKSMQDVLNLIWKHLLPGMADQPLSSNDEQHGALRGIIDSLEYVPLSSDLSSAAAELVTGKRFTLDENEHKLLAASFHFEGDECTVIFQSDRGEQQVRCGIGRWIEGNTNQLRQMSKVAASGMWRDANTFVMEWRFVETPFRDTITCQFEEDRVKIELINHIGGSKEPFIVQGKQE